MDFVMPVMTGPEATSKIRELGFYGLIVGVTGNALPEDVKTFERSGADAVLLKPLDVPMLKRWLLNYIESRQLLERDDDQEASGRARDDAEIRRRCCSYPGDWVGGSHSLISAGI
jgi:DNA-binding NarL/FixJ family response regulator